MNEKNTTGWHTFGKVSAWTLGVGAVGAVIIGIGNGIYNSGFKKGIYLTDLNARTANDQEIEHLTTEGRLIPENGCLRYKVAENNGVVYEEVTSRCDLEMIFTRAIGKRTVGYFPKEELQFALQNDGIYTQIGSVSGQEPKLTVKRKGNREWKTLDLKLD